MTNTHTLIQMPASADHTTPVGQQRLFNKAQIQILVSNTTVRAIIQKAPSSADLPGADTSPIILSTNFGSTNSHVVTALLPFLTITNRFYDRREAKTNFVSQIDIGKYRRWIETNSLIVGLTGKYPTGEGNYPTILFVADNRTTAVAKTMYSVRITNGVAPPFNGGQGFTLATPNPLYVWGDYNCTNTAYLGTTNTVGAKTVPSALMSDALTVLSKDWLDSESTQNLDVRRAANTTINAAILSGVVPSINDTDDGFSGGVHNLPRMLEDWAWSSPRKVLTINTSMINLFQSSRATGQFLNPGTYYQPPTRAFSYDLKFRDPTQVPPGMPCALVALRFGWSTPPPNTVTNNVVF
jgi:hypothetical protein